MPSGEYIYCTCSVDVKISGFVCPVAYGLHPGPLAWTVLVSQCLGHAHHKGLLWMSFTWAEDTEPCYTSYCRASQSGATTPVRGGVSVYFDNI